MLEDCLNKKTLTFFSLLFFFFVMDCFKRSLFDANGGRDGGIGDKACDSFESFFPHQCWCCSDTPNVSGLLLKLEFHISCIIVSMRNGNHVLPLQGLFIVCTVQALDF